MPFSYLFLGLVLLVFSLKIYLNQRQKKSIQVNQDTVPKDFRESVSKEEHQKAAKYNLAKLCVGNMEEVIATIMLVVFTLGGGIQLINDKLVQFNYSPITHGVLVILTYTVIGAIISLPFSIYSTFGIEQKFGFNNTTIKLFILDLIKSLMLAVVIGVPLLYLVLYLMDKMGEFWWLWVWGTLVVFNLLVLIIYPLFIAPLFNKFTPLDDVELKTRIDNLLNKCGFKSNGVFVMDGSKRSSHGNAYFTGIGRSKRIVFFDTLLKQLSHDEIEAVLAHELGHFKEKHVLKQMLVMFGLTLVMLYALNYLIKLPEFYQALGVNSVNNANALLLFSILIGVLGLFFAPVSSFLSRKNEFAADKFAAFYTNKAHLISGLTKLYRDNASTLTPDPLFVRFYYSHPPASIRIKHLLSN